MTRASALLALVLAAAAPSRASDLILYDGKVFLAPGRYAQAVAVKGGRITEVGDSKELLSRAGPRTRRIDLSGRAVVPGFHDAHVHFSEGALQSSRLDPAAAMEAALLTARSLGVTSLSGPLEGDGRRELDFWAEMQRQDKTTLRRWLWGSLDAPSDFEALRKEYSRLLPADRFHWSGLKGWVDGDFDGWTAALLEGYADKPRSRGRMRYAPWELKDLVARGRDLGYSVHLHAIGDRAVRAALDACSPGATGAPRCAIEHADLTAESDRARFAARGVVASVQPVRSTGRGDALAPRLGPSASRAFSLKSLQSAGAPLAFGSDWPDQALDPVPNLFAAAAGADPDERISLEEAVVHYTAGSARAAGADRELGLVRAGYLADLVVFDRDLFSLSGKAILEARVDATIFDGRIVYARVDARGF